jgi:hypothetical protein
LLRRGVKIYFFLSWFMKEEEKKKKTEILHNRITWESDAGRSTPNIKNRRYIEIGLIYKDH